MKAADHVALIAESSGRGDIRRGPIGCAQQGGCSLDPDAARCFTDSLGGGATVRLGEPMRAQREFRSQGVRADARLCADAGNGAIEPARRRPPFDGPSLRQEGARGIGKLSLVDLSIQPKSRKLAGRMTGLSTAPMDRCADFQRQPKPGGIEFDLDLLEPFAPDAIRVRRPGAVENDPGRMDRAVAVFGAVFQRSRNVDREHRPVMGVLAHADIGRVDDASRPCTAKVPESDFERVVGSNMFSHRRSPHT